MKQWCPLYVFLYSYGHLKENHGLDMILWSTKLANLDQQNSIKVNILISRLTPYHVLVFLHLLIQILSTQKCCEQQFSHHAEKIPTFPSDHTPTHAQSLLDP